MQTTSGSALLLVACLILAGCSAPAEGPAADTQALDGDELPALAPTATLVGDVVDRAFRSIDGANVRLAPVGNGTALETNATELGEFQFANLTLGAYTLFVSAPGFLAHEQSIDLAQTEAGVRVVLERIDGIMPRMELHQINGIIACDFIFQPTHSHENGHEHGNTRCDGALGGDRHQWDIPVERGAEGIIVELTWEAGTELARFLLVRVHDQAGTLVAETEASSPLRLHISRSNLEQSVPTGGTLRAEALVGAGEDSGGSDHGVGWQFQQEFEAFASIFYGYQPAPDHSVVR